MNKRKFQLSPEQTNELQGVYQQCSDGALKIRYQAVRLYGIGYSVNAVIEITGCSRRRLLAWCRSYRAYGVAGLVDHRVGGNSAKLSSSALAVVAAKLHQYRPNQLLRNDEYSGSGDFWSVSELAIWLEREFDVVYRSTTSYRSVLKHCGLSRQRPAQQYKSRSEAKVITFEEQLEKN
jgi:transposase